MNYLLERHYSTAIVLGLLWVITGLFLVSCDRKTSIENSASGQPAPQQLKFTDTKDGKEDIHKKKGIKPFLDSLEFLFKEKIDTDPGLIAAYYDHFDKLYKAMGEFFPKKAYIRIQDGSYNRVYTNDHKPTEGHNYLDGMKKGPYPCAYAVVARIRKMESEGVDIAPYQLDKFKPDVDTLFKTYEQLYEFAKVNMSPEEVELLKADLKREKKRKKKKLTVEEIFDYCLLPENADRYPSVHNAWKAAYALGMKRAHIDAEFEIEVAKRYYMLMRELLVHEHVVEKYVGKHYHNTHRIDDLDTRIPQYRGLVKGYAQYLEYKKQAGLDYQYVKYANKIRKGAENKIVTKIKERLAAEGYWQGDRSPKWEKNLTGSLVHYQRNHLLSPSGRFDTATAKSFEITIRQRVEQIGSTLKILRGSPFRWEDFYVLADPCRRTLEVIKEQKTAGSFPVSSSRNRPENRTSFRSNAILGVLGNDAQNQKSCSVCGVYKSRASEKVKIFELKEPEKTCLFGTKEGASTGRLPSGRKVQCIHVMDVERFASSLTENEGKEISFYISCLPAMVNNLGEVVFAGP